MLAQVRQAGPGERVQSNLVYSPLQLTDRACVEEYTGFQRSDVVPQQSQYHNIVYWLYICGRKWRNADISSVHDAAHCYNLPQYWC